VESQIERLLGRQAALQGERERLQRAVAAEQRAPRADWAAAAFPWDARVQQLLGEVFGLGGFRPLQREVINATMQVGAGCWTLAERL
jgi:ATP-dependent DNA helicase Q1